MRKSNDANFAISLFLSPRFSPPNPLYTTRLSPPHPLYTTRFSHHSLTVADKATAEFSPPAGFRVYADDSLNSLMERLNEVESGGQTFVLHEDGDPLWEYLESEPLPPLEQPVTIVLGDQKGILPQDEAALSSFSALRVSVGTLSLLTSQVITIVHHYLDRRHVSGPH